jgi:hypothetical protein
MVQSTIGALTCPPPCFGSRNHGRPLQGLTGKAGKLGIGAEQHQAIMLSKGCQHAIKVNTMGLGVGTGPQSRTSKPSTCSQTRRVCRGPLQSRHLATIEVEAQHLHRSLIHLDLVGGCPKQRLSCWQVSRVNPLGRFASIKLAGECPQVVAGDNLGAATRKLSHPATRSPIGTGFS